MSKGQSKCGSFSHRKRQGEKAIKKDIVNLPKVTQERIIKNYNEAFDLMDKIKDMSNDKNDKVVINVDAPTRNLLKVMAGAYNVTMAELNSILIVNFYAKHGKEDVTQYNESLGSYTSDLFKA